MIDRIAQDIQAQGWSYQTKVLDKQHLQSLSSLFESDFGPARVGKNEQKQRVEEIRGDWIRWLDPRDPPEELSREMKFFEEIKLAFNQRFYLGLKDFECHLAKYPSGSFYKKHLDRFENDSSRSVTIIFYLHEEWKPEYCGELVLYNKQNEILKTILPEPGSVIVFISEDFPHEVKTCSRERRSLTGWINTKNLS